MAKKASGMWADSEPDSRFMLFSGAGHIVNMDVPPEFNNALETIIN